METKIKIEIIPPPPVEPEVVIRMPLSEAKDLTHELWQMDHGGKKDAPTYRLWERLSEASFDGR